MTSANDIITVAQSRQPIPMEQWENRLICNFVPPKQIITKLGIIDYIQEPYPHAQFRYILSAGKFPPMWNIATLWLFVPCLFSCNHLKTRRRTLTNSDSKRAESAEEVPFRSLDQKRLPPHP